MQIIEKFMLKNNKLIKVVITLLLVSSGILTVHGQIGLPGGGTDPDSDCPPNGRVSDNHTGYYYLPDIGVYYDISAHLYIYASNKEWVHRASLPVKYRQYDISHGYKVVLNLPCPWLHDDELRARYARNKRRKGAESQTEQR
ncbi:MAG TPA: OCRE domain-containing protein [Mucilaginibacter sp.]|jgi:hypothetical protein|nr:OCRE domain-containing protein [Mucilaginibacter sp.]